MTLPADFVERVRSATNIADVIGSVTELKGNGSALKGLCPYPDHKEKSPSFTVNVEKGLFHCFGCKKGGDVFHFLRTYHGLTFREAVEQCARKAGLTMPQQVVSGPAAQRQRERLKLLEINKKAATFFYQSLRQLSADHPVWEYIKKRGLTDQAVEEFKLGYAPDDWSSLLRTLERQGVRLEDAETLGLVVRRKKSQPGQSPFFDQFRHRLIFPIVTKTGDIVGFGARSLRAEDEPKYINSRETPVFTKGRTLYGLRVAGKHIVEHDSVVVVEGYMDAITLSSVGVRNVVAILGTAFTPEHAEALAKVTPNVLMLLDGDRAGIDAAERSLPILLAAGLRPRGVILPDGMDPDDFARARGGDELRRKLESAPELFSLVLETRWMQGYRADAAGRLAVLEQALPPLAAARDEALAELALVDLGRLLELDPQTLRRRLAQARLAHRNAEAARASAVGGPNRPANGAQASGSRSTSGSSPVAAGPTPVGAQGANLAAESGHKPANPSRSGEIGPSATPISALASEEDLPAEEAFEIIELKGAPSVELMVLSLLIHGLKAQDQQGDEPKGGVGVSLQEGLQILQAERDGLFRHPGTRALAQAILNRAGHGTEGFANLAVSLANRVDDPRHLMVALNLIPALIAPGSPGASSAQGDDQGQAEATGRQQAQALFLEYIETLRRNKNRQEARTLTHRLKVQRAPEEIRSTLEQIAQAVRAQRSGRGIEVEE